MKRGEIWTVSGAGYAGKPRPAVIVQNDLLDTTASVGICVFTSDDKDLPCCGFPCAQARATACARCPG